MNGLRCPVRTARSYPPETLPHEPDRPTSDEQRESFCLWCGHGLVLIPEEPAIRFAGTHMTEGEIGYYARSYKELQPFVKTDST